MVKITIVLFLFTLTHSPIFGQSQGYSFTELEILPYNVNTEANEVAPLMSPDGKYLFFVRSLWNYNVGGKYSGHDIWTAELLTSGWRKATNIQTNFNSTGNEAIVGITENGTGAYFMSTQAGKRVQGIYYAKRVKGVWGKPEFIKIEGIDTSGNVGFYMHPDGTTLLVTMTGDDSIGGDDIYVCLKKEDGSWSSPKNLGSSINTTGYEVAPFLSLDKKRIFFTSNGHQGLGDGDIFYADRLYDTWDTWSIPQNLGEPVNGKFFDGYCSMFNDSLFYFSSNRKGTSLDIYSAKVGFATRALLSNQRYLTPNERRDFIPDGVSMDLHFENGTTELTSAQVELIWFVAHKILLNREIKVHLVATHEEKQGVSGTRLRNVATQLGTAGIDNVRILDINPGVIEDVEKTGAVSMRLFK